MVSAYQTFLTFAVISFSAKNCSAGEARHVRICGSDSTRRSTRTPRSNERLLLARWLSSAQSVRVSVGARRCTRTRRHALQQRTWRTRPSQEWKMARNSLRQTCRRFSCRWTPPPMRYIALRVINNNNNGENPHSTAHTIQWLSLMSVLKDAWVEMSDPAWRYVVPTAGSKKSRNTAYNWPICPQNGTTRDTRTWEFCVPYCSGYCPAWGFLRWKRDFSWAQEQRSYGL